ncbi:MAG: (Fe-S)-binding protein [Hyphomicrobiaceae bacterium]
MTDKAPSARNAMQTETPVASPAGRPQSDATTSDRSAKRPRVGLFVTCLVNLFRPSIGLAAVRLLEDAGCDVAVPEAQVCCGQPAYNSGDSSSTREIAKQIIAAFESYDYVVGPSGSCMATIRCEYPKLFDNDAAWAERAANLAGRSYELFDFLTNVMKATPRPVRCEGTATYHDSCSGLRSLNIKEQPRQLLTSVEGLQISEMQDAETCCGFGGTFCVKYPAISVKMADDKLANVAATNADYLLGGDLGCLLNIAGRMTRTGSPVKVYHAAEVLAGMSEEPAIGRGDDD